LPPAPLQILFLKMDIRFTHNSYLKFTNIEIDRRMRLLEVFIAYSSKLSEEFVEYDTSFISGDGSKHNYPLPKGKVIILLLIDPCGGVFTTVRRFTERKYEHYMNSRGKEFCLDFSGNDES